MIGVQAILFFDEKSEKQSASLVVNQTRAKCDK